MTDHFFPGPMSDLYVLWGYGYANSLRVADDQIVALDLELRVNTSRSPRPARGLMDVSLHPDFELRATLHVPPAPPSVAYPSRLESRSVALRLPSVPSLPVDYIRVICLKVEKQFNAPPGNPTFWCSTCEHELECLMEP